LSDDVELLDDGALLDDDEPPDDGAPPDGAEVAGAAGGLPTPIFLWGCCASGSTNGPFCPQPRTVPAAAAAISKRMFRIREV